MIRKWKLILPYSLFFTLVFFSPTIFQNYNVNSFDVHPKDKSYSVQTFIPTQTSTAQQQSTKKLPHYTLIADYNYQAHTLIVSEKIEYYNQNAVSLTNIILVVEPERKADVFSLQSVSWEDNRPIKGVSLSKGRLEIPLEKALAPDTSITFNIDYKLTIPFQRGTFGTTNRQTNFGNWYPYVPPYELGKGWLTNNPSNVGEHLVYDLADYSVEIRLDGEQAITIAAPAKANVLGNVYRYEHPKARNFTWSASKEYTIVWNNTDKVTIMGYVFPQHKQAGIAAAGYIREALDFYSKILIPYPRPLLTFVEADFFDGMEYDGIHFLDQVYFSEKVQSPRSGLCTLNVHEVCHQWMGGLVGNNQAKEPWLDESLCTYNELLFYENNYPLQVHWWWDYRINIFRPKGWVNADIYYYKTYRDYVNAVYLRGALFLDDIRTASGVDKFNSFLRDYVHQYQYQECSAEDFFSLLSKKLTKDKITIIKDKYFINTEN